MQSDNVGTELVDTRCFRPGKRPKNAIASPTADTSVELPAYDVVSVRQNKSGTKSFRSGYTPNGLSVENASLLMLIRQAYAMFDSLDDKFLQVPEWAKTERYDIQAKVDASDIEDLHKLSAAQRGLMLQALLADRFKLTTHQEIREQPVYALVVAKSGPKLKEAKPDDTYPNGIDDGHGHKADTVRMSRGGFIAQAIPMSSLESILTQIVERTVLDKTELTGKYNVTLSWSPEENQTAFSTAADITPSDSAGPSIFTALQEQLGLKLESQKAPVEVLVIDHVERPSEN